MGKSPSCLIFRISSKLLLMLLLQITAWSKASSSSVSIGFTVTRVPDDKEDFTSNLTPIISSSDGKISLMLTGCSMVLMRKLGEQQEKVLWLEDYRDCDGTQDEWNTLHLQEDGDLVIYGNTNTHGIIPRWRSSTRSKGVRFMQLSETGSLQLLDQSSSIVWQITQSLSIQQKNAAADHHLRQLQQQHWYQNYSCIFDNSNSFSYLHVGYVYYFNITNKEAFQASIDDCLNTCTGDCSCSAAVYNVETDYCYEFHQYIPVQTLPFNPVQRGDTLSVYIKVERGSSGSQVRYLISRFTFWVSMVVAAATLVL